jgi:hypothetical protein
MQTFSAIVVPQEANLMELNKILGKPVVQNKHKQAFDVNPEKYFEEVF